MLKFKLQKNTGLFYFISFIFHVTEVIEVQYIYLYQLRVWFSDCSRSDRTVSTGSSRLAFGCLSYWKRESKKKSSVSN